MGVRIRPGELHMAYPAFNRLRQAAAEAIGGSYPPHSDPLKYPDAGRFYTGGWHLEERPGLALFFLSNDYSVTFTPEECKQIADDLSRWVLPGMNERREFFDQIGHGHIAALGGYYTIMEQLIESFHQGYNSGTGVRYG